MFACDHEPLKMLKLRSTKAAAASQADRVEPELRSLSIPLNVDVRWLVAVCRVEEKPVRALTMNCRHQTSVSPCVFDSRRFSLGSCPARIDFVELIHPEAIFIRYVEPELFGAIVEAPPGSQVAGLVHDQHR